MMRSILSLVVLGCLCVVGCDDKPAAPTTSPKDNAPAMAPAPAPAPSAMTEKNMFQPKYSVAIEESNTDPKQYTVTWSARVNTGGWTMTTDKVLIEEHMGAMAARIYVTLEQPSPSDTVTQAFETITGKHDSGTTRIQRVEFSVRRTTRGAKYDSQPGYGVVKSIKYPN
jgi:hypothetical protein